MISGHVNHDHHGRLETFIYLRRLSLDPNMRPASVEREITQELHRHKQSLDQQFATEAAQAAERASRVPVEVAQQGGSTLNLRERLGCVNK